MSDTEITQIGNIVDGDVVAGSKSVTVNNHYNKYDHCMHLGDLYDKYIAEKKANKKFDEFIDDLDYYNSKKSNEPIVGLENKLIAGNRQHYFPYASDVKEQYHKKLLKTSQFSIIAQQINAYVLGSIRSNYMLFVYPLICSEADETTINDLINEKVINPLIMALGNNIFNFTPDEIQGMIYFLTGNCHIKWTA